MQLVLDTNVVVSAFINPAGTPSQILKLVLQGKAKLIINTSILMEYEKVMARPKFEGHIKLDLVHRFTGLLKTIGHSFEPLPSNIKLPDESDRIFYDTARSSDSLLISGNIKHYPKESFIMLPGDFLKKLR